MTTKYRITEKQLKKMIEFGESFPKYKGQPKKQYRFYYTNLTPEDVYVSYESYFMEDDGSIGSESHIKCIDSLGIMRDCMEQFESFKDRMNFTSSMIELFIDDMEVVRFR